MSEVVFPLLDLSDLAKTPSGKLPSKADFLCLLWGSVVGNFVGTNRAMSDSGILWRRSSSRYNLRSLSEAKTNTANTSVADLSSSGSLTFLLYHEMHGWIFQDGSFRRKFVTMSPWSIVGGCHLQTDTSSSDCNFLPLGTDFIGCNANSFSC